MNLILVHSPKGGVGSTMVAAYLAQEIARRGADVAAVDFGGLGSLGLYFGVRGDPAGQDPDRQTDDMLVIGGVRLLSSSRADLTVEEALGLLGRAKHGDATIIADIPAGSRGLLAALLPAAAVHLCVLSPQPGAVALLPTMLAERLRGVTHFVLNGVDERLKLTRDIMGFLRGTLGSELIGVIRRDEAVNEALAMLSPLIAQAPQSAALADVQALAGRVTALLPHPLSADPEAEAAA